MEVKTRCIRCIKSSIFRCIGNSIRYSTLSIVDDDGHVAGIDGDALLLHQRSLLA